MSSSVGVPYALWLIPSENYAFQYIIDDLASQFKTPSFGAHATLCSGEWKAGLDTLQNTVDELCCSFCPVLLDVDGLGQTNSYFRFFYVALIDNDQQQIFHRVTSIIGGSRIPSIGPHMSLMYSDRVNEIDRESLQKKITPDVPPQIKFESIQLILPSTGRWQDTESWVVKHSAKFAALQSNY